MPLGFGSSRKAGRLEVEVAADTDEFDKAMDELPRKAKKAGDEAGAAFHEANASRLNVLKGWLAVNAAAIVGTLAYVFRDKLNPALNKTLGTFGKFATFLSGPMRLALANMTRVVGKLATSVFDWLSLGVKGAGRALRAFGERLTHEGVILNGFGKAVTTVGHAFEKFGKILAWIAGIWTKFKLGAVLGIGIFLAMSLKAAAGFTNSFARVRTLLKGMAETDLRLLGTAARRMSNEIGISSKEINDTLYQTLSAMPQLAADTAAAMEIVAVAAKVAATGFAEADTAVRAVTGIMNAWKLEAADATAVADAMFAAQDQGVTTFGEMAASIGEVSGLTAALGGDWRDLLAIVATNTPFISTSETITGIASALSGVLEQGAPARTMAEQLGLDFSAAALKAKGLIPFLREVVELTKGDPEIIAKLFGRREAVQLVVNLAQNMDSLNEKLEKVKQTTGSLEQNFKIMNNTVERQTEIMKTRFSGLLASQGLDFERWSIIARKAVNEVLEALTELAERQKEAGAENQKAGEDAVGGFWYKLLPRDVRLVVSELAKMDEEWQEVNTAAGKAISTMWGLTRTDLSGGMAEAITVAVEQGFGEGGRAGAEAMIDAINAGGVDAYVTDILDQGVLAWARQTRISESVARAFVEPRALDYSQRKVEDFGRALKAAALFEFMDDRDVEAYSEALDEARVKMNALVLAERNRLIAAGVETKVANKLLDLYQMADLEAQKAAEAQAAAATKALGQMLRIREVAEKYGATGMKDAPEELRPVISAINKVEAEMLSIAETLKVATPLTNEWYGAMARLEELREHRAELADIGSTYLALLPVIEKFGKGIVDSVAALPVEEQREFFTLALDTAKILDTVTDAQIAYNLAVEEFGEDSEEATDAQATLKTATEGARKILLVMIAVFDALNLATDELRAGLLSLSGVLAGLGGGDGTAKRGGLLGFLFENAETIEGLARGLLSVADAIGEIGVDARRSLQGVIDLASGIKTIKDSLAAGQGLSIGGIAQSIGGAIGLISGVVGMFTGESASDKRRREMLERNTEALRALKDSLDRQREIALGLTQVQRDHIDTLTGLLGPVVNAEGRYARFAAITEFMQEMDRLGLTIEDLERWFADLGIEIDLVSDEGEASIEAWRRAWEALQEIGIEDTFAGVEGEMNRLRIEMNLFDVDEPLDQLKKYYEFLQDQEVAIPQFDLDTAEGRAALDDWIRAFITNWENLDPDDLGKLSPEQILALIETMEGLGDSIDEGPDSTSFQEFRGITEVTANRLAGLLTTDVYWNEITALNVRELVKLMGGVPLGPAGADDLTPNYDDPDYDDPDRPRRPPEYDGPGHWIDPDRPTLVLSVNTDIETVEVNVIEAQDMNADEVADVVVDRVGRELGNKVVRQVRSGGGMPTRTVR